MSIEDPIKPKPRTERGKALEGADFHPDYKKQAGVDLQSKTLQEDYIRQIMQADEESLIQMHKNAMRKNCLKNEDTINPDDYTYWYEKIVAIKKRAEELEIELFWP